MALEVLPALEAEALERKAEGGRNGRPTQEKDEADRPHLSERGPQARDEAARLVGASGRSVALTIIRGEYAPDLLDDLAGVPLGTPGDLAGVSSETPGELDHDPARRSRRRSARASTFDGAAVDISDSNVSMIALSSRAEAAGLGAPVSRARANVVASSPRAACRRVHSGRFSISARRALMLVSVIGSPAFLRAVPCGEGRAEDGRVERSADPSLKLGGSSVAGVVPPETPAPRRRPHRACQGKPDQAYGSASPAPDSTTRAAGRSAMTSVKYR